MDDLKPCPFCGSTTISHGGDNTWTGAWCEDCGAMGPNQYGKKEWNDRVTIGDLSKAIKMLEREIRRVQQIRLDVKPPHKVDLSSVQSEYELMLAELTETDK